jgi:hypothetical protein
MEYLIIKDGIITEHCCGSELPEDATQIDSFIGIVGEPTTYYNDDWTRKSNIELYKENIVYVPTDYKLNDDKTAIVEMSQVEKINAGIETLAAGYKISGDSVIEKTNAEKLADNEITQSEYDALVQKRIKKKL